MKHTLLLGVTIFWIVGLNVVGGVILKALANRKNVSLILFGLGIMLVILVNGLRLLVWMFANKRFPLSTTYPLTSIFFPIMLGVSYLYGEPINTYNLLGTLLITAGVFWLGTRDLNHASTV